VNGHVTHVSGTLVGREVNGTRIGVAPGVQNLLIGKVLGANGSSTESLLNAIAWALGRRADVVSLSLGINYPTVVTTFVAHGFPTTVAASRALAAYLSTVRLFDRLAAFVQAPARGALLVAASGDPTLRG